MLKVFACIVKPTVAQILLLVLSIGNLIIAIKRKIRENRIKQNRNHSQIYHVASKWRKHLHKTLLFNNRHIFTLIWKIKELFMKMKIYLLYWIQESQGRVSLRFSRLDSISPTVCCNNSTFVYVTVVYSRDYLTDRCYKEVASKRSNSFVSKIFRVSSSPCSFLSYVSICNKTVATDRWHDGLYGFPFSLVLREPTRLRILREWKQREREREIVSAGIYWTDRWCQFFFHMKRILEDQFLKLRALVFIRRRGLHFLLFLTNLRFDGR